MSSPTHVFVSGYTQAPYGSGPGVVRYALAPDGSIGSEEARATAAVNPSYLAAGGSVLLSVEELPQGRIVALDPGTLELVGRASSGGADPCHLTLCGSDVWTANYTSGTACVTALAELIDGGFMASTTPASPDLLSHPGTGPVIDRQSESHAHQVTFTPWGTVLVSDLGADRIDEYDAHSHVLRGSAQLPPGSGPRHVAIKGAFLLVAAELDGHLHVLRRNVLADGADHSWTWLLRTPLAYSLAEQEDAKEFYPSHLELAAEQDLLYVAVRGANTLVVLDVSGLCGDNPEVPRVLSVVDSGGNWPRHLALGENVVYVANQRSDTVTVFSLDQDGLPGAEPVQTIGFGSPACVLLG
ncbi:lactonase family protein [Arthrobacter cryoconiti]|uniref:Lactonase family protein n=1 Tax=Arthrobacter cryoconiti TaxID=748907 RepID=A0ABV8R2P5_9MICC|nr:beta-propeller fold lactonase family protein [Arthrobacter cryoconiti]MCC9067139.1 lactonase family protein [Arthrobacter cryoconiti]